MLWLNISNIDTSVYFIFMHCTSNSLSAKSACHFNCLVKKLSRNFQKKMFLCNANSFLVLRALFDHDSWSFFTEPFVNSAYDSFTSLNRKALRHKIEIKLSKTKYFSLRKFFRLKVSKILYKFIKQINRTKLTRENEWRPADKFL